MIFQILSLERVKAICLDLAHLFSAYWFLPIFDLEIAAATSSDSRPRSSVAHFLGLKVLDFLGGTCGGPLFISQFMLFI